MKKNLNSENLLVALDIGTTKICILVAQKISDADIDIIGIGHVPSLGMSKGVVVDISQAVHTIKLALKEAELMAGCKVESANVGISGAHIQSINSNGMIPIKKDRVRQEDVNTVLAAAKAIVVPEGQQILHVLPQYFIIDGQHKVLDPVGMFGVRLEARTHIITGSVASVQNIVRCCQISGLHVSDIVLEHLASADAVLSEDEKLLGAGILDIGGGTSDFAIYQQKAIRYTKVFAVAGNHVTNDIALCLRATIKDAERVKCEFGSTMLFPDLQEVCDIELAQGGTTKLISVQDLVNIIEPRVTELLLMLEQEISMQHLRHLMPAGLVLTGGGSLLKDIEKNAKNILNMPIRIGYPNVSSRVKDFLNSPIYATGYGLLLHMVKKNEKKFMNHLTGPLVSRIFWRMRSWVSDFF